MYLIATNLLKLAQEMLPHSRGRPDQAVLRRVVSTAYYAVFHRIIEKSVDQVAGKQVESLRSAVARAFDHGAMKALSRAVATGSPPKAAARTLKTISQELRTLAELFAWLQEERHLADYDLSVQFGKERAVLAVKAAQTAFALLDNPTEDMIRYLVLLPVSKQIQSR